MNINKKGFTLAELLAVIVVLMIISGLAVFSMSGVIGTGKKGIYKNFEITLKGAVQNYLIDNPGEIPSVGNSKNIYAKDISTYLDEFGAIDGGDCNYAGNNSFVKVTRGNDVSHNFNLTYQTCLICVDSNHLEIYKTSGC